MVILLFQAEKTEKDYDRIVVFCKVQHHVQTQVKVQPVAISLNASMSNWNNLLFAKHVSVQEIVAAQSVVGQ